MQADMVLEPRILHPATNSKLTASLGNILSIENLKAGPHSEIFPPREYFLLRVLLCLGAILFQITTAPLMKKGKAEGRRGKMQMEGDKKETERLILISEYFYVKKCCLILYTFTSWFW